MLRRRELNKELEKQKGLYKSNKAAFEAQPNKAGVLASLYLARMNKAEERLKQLKSFN
jgi:hypothetical protein